MSSHLEGFDDSGEEAGDRLREELHILAERFVHPIGIGPQVRAALVERSDREAPLALHDDVVLAVRVSLTRNDCGLGADPARYRVSNTCNGNVVSGNRTVWSGKSGRRTGRSHSAAGHKGAYFGRMSSATTQAVRHPGQFTSRRIASPSSANLNVKKSGLLHRGQLKFRPPTVMRVPRSPERT